MRVRFTVQVSRWTMRTMTTCSPRDPFGMERVNAHSICHRFRWFSTLFLTRAQLRTPTHISLQNLILLLLLQDLFTAGLLLDLPLLPLHHLLLLLLQNLLTKHLILTISGLQLLKKKGHHLILVSFPTQLLHHQSLHLPPAPYSVVPAPPPVSQPTSLPTSTLRPPPASTSKRSDWVTLYPPPDMIVPDVPNPTASPPPLVLSEPIPSPPAFSPPLPPSVSGSMRSAAVAPPAVHPPVSYAAPPTAVSAVPDGSFQSGYHHSQNNTLRSQSSTLGRYGQTIIIGDSSVGQTSGTMSPASTIRPMPTIRSPSRQVELSEEMAREGWSLVSRIRVGQQSAM